MKCKYVSDAGVECKSNFACVDPKDPKYEYCFKHAQKLKLVPEAELARYEEKRALRISESAKDHGFGTLKERRKKIKAARETEAAVKVREEQKEKAEKVTAEAEELIHRILDDRNYDAFEIVNGLKKANADFKYSDKIRKFVFINWHMAEPLSRKPGTMKELCELLGMTVAKGKEWVESDWFVTDLHDALKKTMKLAFPYVARMNLIQALAGDKDSKKEFFKLFGKHEAMTGEDDIEDLMSEDIKREIEETIREN